MEKSKILILQLLLYLVVTVSAFGATDPFAPKNQITLWFEDSKQKGAQAAQSLLAQAGFLAVNGAPSGKAIITNIAVLSPEQLKLLEAYHNQGGKIILLGTENYPGIIFLGKQVISGDLVYLEINDSGYQKIPKVLAIPQSTRAVSLFTTLEPSSVPLAGYLSFDGVKKSHIDLLNSAVVRTRWGMYSGFDWFDAAFLDDPEYRQLLILWLRKTIWS